jgi:hypothetical protein
VANIEIQLLRVREAYGTMAGEPSIQLINVGNGVRTNEKGEYRMKSLSPGDYYIRAAWPAGSVRRTIGALAPTANDIAATYYPGVSNPDAAFPVKVPAGADVQIVDFPIDPVSPFKVSGRIVNPMASTPAERYSYFLVRRDTKVHDGDGLVPDVDPDIERFEFRNIPPGSYTLYVGYRSGPNFGDAFFVGRLLIEVVDRDVTGLTVAIEPGIDIAGTWKSESPNGTIGGRVSLQPVDGMPAALVPEPSLRSAGTVEVSHTPPGRYLLSFALPQTLYVATARFGPRDVLGQPFEVDEHSVGPLRLELSTQGGTFSGTVTGRDEKTVAGAFVVLLPPMNLRMDEFSYKTATTNAQGNFSIAGIRPGAYTVFAIAEKPEANISIGMTPYLNYGTPIEVGKDQWLSQNLTLIPKQD